MSGYGIFQLWPAVKNGFFDGLNPCAGAILLIFVMVLSGVGYTGKRIFVFGLLFIGVTIFMHYVSAIGFWDYLWTLPVVTYWVRIVYFVLSCGFCVIGVLDVADRFRYERHGDIRKFRMPLPIFFCATEGGSHLSTWLRVAILGVSGVVIILMAALLTFASAIYPQSEYVFVLHSHLLSGSNVSLSSRSIFTYSTMMVLPLVIAWLIIFWIGTRKKRNKVLILFYKSILSALFISIGVGLAFSF